jgi:hypothetical protein
MTRRLIIELRRQWSSRGNRKARATLFTRRHGRFNTRSAPSARYVAGKYAKPMIMIRNWLGDRMFDRVIMSQTG